MHQKLDPSGETVVNMSHALRDIDIHRYELLGSMGNELFARQWQVIRVIPELQDYIQVNEHYLVFFK